jgi:hypothetical protein
MAHSCPDCGQACYCGGDLDDCLFDDTVAADLCTHCFAREDDGEADGLETDEPEPEPR